MNYWKFGASLIAIGLTSSRLQPSSYETRAFSFRSSYSGNSHIIMLTARSIVMERNVEGKTTGIMNHAAFA